MEKVKNTLEKIAIAFILLGGMYLVNLASVLFD